MLPAGTVSVRFLPGVLCERCKNWPIPSPPAILLALRPLQAQSQGSGRKTSPLPALSPSPRGLSHLPAFSEIVGKDLRPAHRRLAAALSARQQTATATSLSTRQTLPPSRQRRRRSRSGRRPQNRLIKNATRT